MKTLSKAAQKREEQAQALTRLRSWLVPGAKVYTKCTHVARSGMSRSIEAFIITDGELNNITWAISDALDYSFDSKNGGIKMGGCGMDMGFSLVYNLSRKVFQEGFTCTGVSDWGNRCPSNDHSNGLKEYGAHIQHSDPGYALRHSWI